MPGIVHYGWAETTPALRSVLARGAGMLRSSGRRRRKKANGVKKVRKAAKRAGKKAAKAYLVKGSAAAKRHMAKLRKLAKKARG